MTKLHKKLLKKKPELCIRVRALRNETRMSLEDLSDKTHVPIHHLEALERCEYHKLPEGIYRKAMLRKVLEALNEHPEIFIDELITHEKTSAHKPKWQERTQQRTFNMTLFLRTTVSVLVIGIIGGYLGMHVHGILRAPELAVFNPYEGQIVATPQTTIQGKTDADTTIHINGIEVLANSTGQFEQIIPLHIGQNTVRIESKKKFGATSSIDRLVTFEPIEDNEKVSLAP